MKNSYFWTESLSGCFQPLSLFAQLMGGLDPLPLDYFLLFTPEIHMLCKLNFALVNNI